MIISRSIIFASLLLSGNIFFAMSQSDSTGLPGDNFNLEGTLDLFKNSASLEEFERKLNTADNYFNNLDLNEDGEVDYIKIVDHMDGNTHAIVLQTPVNETEIQDVAVITIEKTGEQSAIIQIVGDEDLYGKEKIVEPVESTSKVITKDEGNSSTQNAVINVWTWPSVRYVYAPSYVVYRPGWRWRYYPGYYNAWRPHPYRWHYLHANPYRVNYHVVSTRRVVRAPIIYKNVRNTSVVVKKRYQITNNNNNGGVKNINHVHVKRNGGVRPNGKVVRDRHVHIRTGNNGNRGHKRN